MSYSEKVLIKGSPQQVFKAISGNVHQWWGKTDAPVNQINDEFTTSFAETFWKFRITLFEPDKKIVWTCIEAKHIHSGHEGIEKEWLGTSVEWVLEEQADEKSTLLSFTHNGLVPELNCYDICYPAWEKFVTKSLKSFVESGKGMPALL